MTKRKCDGGTHGPQYDRHHATRQDFMKLARQRNVPAERLGRSYGLPGSSFVEIADGLEQHNYCWDRAMCTIDYIWAHLPYAEQHRA